MGLTQASEGATSSRQAPPPAAASPIESPPEKPEVSAKPSGTDGGSDAALMEAKLRPDKVSEYQKNKVDAQTAKAEGKKAIAEIGGNSDKSGDAKKLEQIAKEGKASVDAAGSDKAGKGMKIAAKVMGLAASVLVWFPPIGTIIAAILGVVAGGLTMGAKQTEKMAKAAAEGQQKVVDRKIASVKGSMESRDGGFVGKAMANAEKKKGSDSEPLGNRGLNQDFVAKRDGDARPGPQGPSAAAGSTVEHGANA